MLEQNVAVIIVGVIGLLSTLSASLIVYVVTRNRGDAKLAEKLGEKEAHFIDEIEQMNKYVEQRLTYYRQSMKDEIEKLHARTTKAKQEAEDAYTHQNTCKLRHKELESCLQSLKDAMGSMVNKLDALKEDIRGVRHQGRHSQAMMLASIQAMEIPDDRRQELMRQFQDVLKGGDDH